MGKTQNFGKKPERNTFSINERKPRKLHQQPSPLMKSQIELLFGILRLVRKIFYIYI